MGARRIPQAHKSNGDFDSEPLSLRFMRQVDVRGPDECWPWRGGVNRDGYGRIYFDGDTHNAHRAAWLITYGKIPKGKFVCHRCDNPACVNPSHLFLGTATSNMEDRDAKGRQAKGEQCGLSKLTDEEIAVIRTSSDSCRVLGRKHGVHFSTIARARRGETWKHLLPQGGVS